MKRLAIITTHPIQYNAPFFKFLAERNSIRIKVFYTWGEAVLNEKYDPGFNKKIEWDIPLLEGYEHVFVKNIAKSPGSHHFNGIINPTLNKEIVQWQPDAVLVYGWSFNSHLKALRFFHNKIPVLFRGDSTLLDEQKGYRSTLRHLFLRWVYKHVDYALYVGQNNKAYFLRNGLREDQLVHAPHAIDNARFIDENNLYDEQAKKWRNELGIKDDELVVLFAGKLEQKKNPLFIFSLAKQINNEKLKFIIVGNGVLENDIRSAAEKPQQVIVLGFQNQQQMPVVYRMGDVFILPSVGPGETWGLSANEAMACGCALMLSNKTGGAVDLIKNKENGIIFDPADTDACVDFIQTILRDRAALENMKQASKNRGNDFSYTITANALESLCEKI